MSDNMSSSNKNSAYKSNTNKNSNNANQSNTGQSNTNQSNSSLDIQIARLAYIGAAIATLGDGISAVAAGLALESLERANLVTIASVRNQYDESSQLNMQQQLDYFINELLEIKKTLH